MSACEWEFTTPKHESIAADHCGMVICTLTGLPCLIDDVLKRVQCGRRLDINSYLIKHPSEGSKLAT